MAGPVWILFHFRHCHADWWKKRKNWNARFPSVDNLPLILSVPVVWLIFPSFAWHAAAATAAAAVLNIAHSRLCHCFGRMLAFYTIETAKHLVFIDDVENIECLNGKMVVLQTVYKYAWGKGECFFCVREQHCIGGHASQMYLCMYILLSLRIQCSVEWWVVFSLAEKTEGGKSGG